MYLHIISHVHNNHNVKLQIVILFVPPDLHSLIRASGKYEVRTESLLRFLHLLLKFSNAFSVQLLCLFHG